MKVEKENYLVLDGARYDAVLREGDTSGSCDGCCFYAGAGECTMPDIDGFSVSCYALFIFAKHGGAAAQQQLSERSEKETVEDSKAKKPGICKRGYYGFPNGVEAEDICRYLPFNLGNVVKYVCRAGRKDATKKIEDLEKAKDYLENEIKRMEEEDD